MSHKLTSKQIKAIYLLAGGATTIQVGKRLKLRRETLSRWKQIPEFTKEFERVMDEVRGDMQHRLTHLVEESISAVTHGINNNYCEPKRLQTAFSVLKLLGIERIIPPNTPANKPEGN
jgi:hypothetical protein